VKSGEIRLGAISGPATLAMMIAEPRLIGRPPTQVGDRCESSFDSIAVDQWIGRPPVTDRCVRTRRAGQEALQQAEHWFTFTRDVFSNHDH
jgi:hypothetical protein